MKTPIPEGYAQRGHVIRLDPTHKQRDALVRAAGVSRFVYNWALSAWNQQYKSGGKPTAANLKLQFNRIKREQFPWVMESPRDANSQPFVDLGRAFSNFFASRSGRRKGPKIGYPTFRKRGKHDSFYVANDKFSVRQRGKRGVVRLPIIGDVRMMEALRYPGRILSGRVYRQADQWFIAINVIANIRVENHVHERAIIGVDLGLKTAVMPSRGEPIDSPKPLRAALQKLKRANRKLHRRKKGGQNRRKAQMQVARIHMKVANVRRDFWNKVTTEIIRKNHTVVIEDLSMAFMLRNRKLARAAADVAPGMLRPRLLYKTSAYGGEVVIANRFYPSTQRCSSCGHIKAGDKKVKLGDEQYLCDECGVVEDRDRNAALSLEQYPRLAGNCGRKTGTPMDDHASIQRAATCRVSTVAEVGTKPCPLVDTI